MALWLYNLSGYAMFSCVHLVESLSYQEDRIVTPEKLSHLTASQHLKSLTVAESRWVNPHVL